MGAVDEGVLELDSVTELGARLQAGSERTRSDRTVFKSVGLAIQDWAICHAVAARLTAHSDAPV
jgi:ornithine cyclodeaminase